MPRNPRYLPHPGAVVEITQRTIQGRFLLKPSPRLNALVAGCLARAQKNTGAKVHAVAVLSNHLHLLMSFETVEVMAQFMCQFKSNLSKEVGLLYVLPGPKFAGRYKSIPLSEEPEIQEQRLKYILSQGAKEGLVLSPRDWPGVHCAEALVSEKPVRGVWVDRTRLYAARQKGKVVAETDFTSEEELDLEPLPFLAGLSSKARRSRVEELLVDIEEGVLAKHRRDETAPLGADFVLSRDPKHRPRRLERSRLPYFHATQRLFGAMMGCFREFLVAYRAAAERLTSGDRSARFPGNCFPPGLPFVPPVQLA